MKKLEDVKLIIAMLACLIFMIGFRFNDLCKRVDELNKPCECQCINNITEKKGE